MKASKTLYWGAPSVRPGCWTESYWIVLARKRVMPYGIQEWCFPTEAEAREFAAGMEYAEDRETP